MKTFFSKHRLFYCNNDIKQSTVAMVNCVIRINKFVGNHHTMEYQASKCAKVNDLCKASLVFFLLRHWWNCVSRGRYPWTVTVLQYLWISISTASIFSLLVHIKSVSDFCYSNFSRMFTLFITKKILHGRWALLCIAFLFKEIEIL